MLHAHAGAMKHSTHRYILPALAGLSTLLAGLGYTTAASAGTISGKGTVSTYDTNVTVSGTFPGRKVTSNAGAAPDPGRLVTVSWCVKSTLTSLNGKIFRNCTQAGTKTLTTDSAGRFSMSGQAGEPDLGVNVSTVGDESSVMHFTGSSATASLSFNAPLLRAPHMLSPNGAMWLRKVGNGDNPLVFIEPWDLSNSTHTGDEVASTSTPPSPSTLASFANQPINQAPTAYDPTGSADNLLNWLLLNNYTLYIITAGNNWRSSQKGVAANNSDGMAYQAMKLAQMALMRYNPSKRLMFAGFSLGGATAKAGLFHWCRGDFAAQIPGETALVANCPEVAGWAAMDAPLSDTGIANSGAHVPISLLRLLKDTDARMTQNPAVIDFKSGINSPAARELFANWVTDGCTTHAFEHGMDSSQAAFRDGCSIDNSVHNSYSTWSGGTQLPSRPATNTQVPAIAFSLGLAPAAGTGFFSPGNSLGCNKPNTATWGDKAYTSIKIDKEYLGIIPGGWTISLRPNENTTDLGECDHGSRANMIDPVGPAASSSSWFNPYLVFPTQVTTTANIPWYPTLIPTSSSLLWARGNASPSVAWRDFMTNPDGKDAQHSRTAYPQKEVGMVLAWLSELSKGFPETPTQHTAPVVTATKNIGSGGQVRLPGFESDADGVDQDGDEMVDELAQWEGPGLTAAFNRPTGMGGPNSVTLISRNRFWKFSWETGTWIDSGYLDAANSMSGFGSNRMFAAPIPVVGFGSQTPWGGPGITAALNPLDTNHVVLFSKDKFWIFKGGSPNTWVASGWVADSAQIVNMPNVMPFFDWNATPTIDGFFPWDDEGITSIEYTNSNDVIVIKSGLRTWRYTFSTRAWVALGHSSSRIGAVWKTPDGTAMTRATIGIPFSTVFDSFQTVRLSDGAQLSSGSLASVWQKIEVPPAIDIESATYGESCGVAQGSQTKAVFDACQGKGTCNFNISVGALGDPAPGCAKEFSVTYVCGSSAAFKIERVPGEANGKTMALTCP